jgi:hypothetical protein
VRQQYLASATGYESARLPARRHDDTYVVDGERVVVLARYTARNKATGKDMVARVAHSFIVRGGQIVGMEQIVDSATVRAAMNST